MLCWADLNGKFVRWLYRWLPVLCGCHRRPDRSLFFRGRQFPVCARCTGLLAGWAAALITVWFWTPPVWLAGILILPTVADGLIQQVSAYESRNRRRLWTGALAGWGGMTLLLLSLTAVYRWGMQVGHQLMK